MADPAPLISISEASVPPDGAAVWLKAFDGRRLRAALFASQAKSRGSVVLSPGRTEPIEKYYEVISELQSRGFTVLVHDWRGQGLSDRLAPDDPLKGSSDGCRAYLRDFDQILEHFRDQLPQPWIIMGHSMGGGLNCLSLALGEKRFAAAVMSAPMIGIQTAGRAPWIVRLTAKITCVLGGRHGWAIPPADPFAETFETNLLTHDEFRWRHWRGYLVAHPELALGGVTWAWIRFAMDLTARVDGSRRVEQLSIPVTIVAAELEKLVDNRASQAFARRAPRGKYVEVEGAYHEVLMETHLRRQKFWSAFDQVAGEVAP